ncbi:hypothetical protein [Nocardia sp. NPDC127526]|uniref:hypothetical protein n=1 Tax=Nocardia sp. NPDC127526 TaxID=3345393 RepID=UPI00362E088A
MSNRETRTPEEELGDAIRRWVAATSGGALATDFILFSAAHDPARVGTSYYLITSEGMPYHTAIGLTQHLGEIVEDSFREE